jgi:hypothetical protein
VAAAAAVVDNATPAAAVVRTLRLESIALLLLNSVHWNSPLESLFRVTAVEFLFHIWSSVRAVQHSVGGQVGGCSAAEPTPQLLPIPARATSSMRSLRFAFV